MLRIFGALVASHLLVSSTVAEDVYVKYRGVVPLDTFACSEVTDSTLINRVCYNQHHLYMLILLKATWYHYCEIEPDVVDGLLTAPSKGKYYNAYIRNGQFGCQDNVVPDFQG